MRFFVALVVDGALTGALYALVALSFVIVYRASRMINFAVGEWVMLASRLVDELFVTVSPLLAGRAASARLRLKLLSIANATTRPISCRKLMSSGP